MGQQFDALRARLGEIRNVQRANAVLSWDQETYMPRGGAAARAEQRATLARLAHTMFVAEETADLLTAAEAECDGLPYDSDDASLLRYVRREYDQTRKVPAALVAEITRHGALAHEVWVEARRTNDYALFAPHLDRSLDLARQRADHLGYEAERYDALLDLFEPGLRTAQVTEIFDALRAELLPLARAIAGRAGSVSDAPVRQPFDEATQERFGVQVARAFGYDFARGRLDRAVHPFATPLDRNDVRITTRFDSDFLNPALFGTMHETGHALYEQGLGANLDGTMLSRGVSSAVHESQSRLWENVVGRSLACWRHFYPAIQEAFPAQLRDVSLDQFYRAINRVEPSFIRVEADEVTYTLHIMLRFEMELGLLDGSILVNEAPGVWTELMDRYLGIVPPTDTAGILQDIHWAVGMFGYFPTYALGTILASQFFAAARRDHPNIPEQIAGGQFDTLRGWLTEQIYRHGRKYTPGELIERATGELLTIAPYLAYLREKFGAIYALT